VSVASRRGEHLIFPETAARISRWRDDPSVLGVLLVGSKSHEHHDDLSDDDLEVVLREEAYAKLRPADGIEILATGEGSQRKLLYDAQFVSMVQFSSRVTSPLDLDHWPYERARVLFDREGDLLPLVESLGKMNPEFRQLRLTHATIDAWIAVYRAQKTAKRGQAASSRLLVSRAARALTRLLFALESRWVPLDHWWAAELHTLRTNPDAVELLIAGLDENDPAKLSSALELLEQALAAEGVPGPAGRRDLFLELVHASRAEERAIHGLV